MTSEEKTDMALEALENKTYTFTDKPEAQKPQHIEAGRLFDTEKMRLASMLAEIFSRSSMVKEQFRGQKGSPGHANCFLALSMALELDIPWMAALTQLYVVRGNIGIPGQMLIALANRRAPIKGRIRYKEEGEGDDLTVTAYVTDRETEEEVSYSLSLAEAKAAGAKGDGWENQPKLRLRYRAATYLIRTTYPEVLLGLYGSDELEELSGAQRGVTAENITSELSDKK